MTEKVLASQGRVKVRKFRRRDLKDRLTWPPHAQALNKHLNYPLSSFLERERWMLTRLTNTGRMYFAILDENDKLIGEMSLREIDMSARTTRLGIHLASNKLGLGYGREALEALLSHYFNVMRFTAMKLDVAAHNVRAIRLYERLHFEHVSPFWRLSEVRDLPVFTDDRYANVRRFFRRKGASLECLFYDMSLTMEHYLETLEAAKEGPRRVRPGRSEKDDAEGILLQE